MMDWLSIVLLILAGTFLVVAEIIFIPGIFVAGTIGVLLSSYGVYLTYDNYGTTTGAVVMIITIVANILALYFTLQGRSWQAFALKETHDGKVNEGLTSGLEVGQEGTSVSSLRPVGKAIFDEQEYEVRTNGDYIKENMAIHIIRMEGNTIFVEPLN
jgi:membrane-bound ClpP family serine protease